ncbi:hypothetical protein [Rheinheimera hassiensis]|uniref:hypothetical protein n=1 Tax=Rheinheimera hassiensis TaxID=1193627 RepID=UPI001F061414|nr:hypothetical protein [Rheinheimera hassiensis]
MKYLVSAFACCVLSACSFVDTDVEFKPEKGEERSYQVYSTAKITVDTGRRTETLNTTSHQLLRYKVIDTGPESRFEVHIDYLQMREGQGSGISSTRAAERNPEMHAIFSQGFEFTANLNSGSVTDFSALNKPVWQALLAERGAELEQEMKKLFSSSAFLSSIPAKVGAKVKLPAYQGQADATLTVLQVTDTQLLAKVESSQAESRFYGHMLLERERGWLEQLALVIEAPFERYGYNGTVRSNVIMLPLKRQLGDITRRFNFDYDFPAFEYEKQPELVISDANKPLTQDAVFPLDAGYFYQQDNQLNLVYQHDFSGFLPEGEFRLTNVSAHNADGSEIPLQLSDIGGLSYPDQDGFYKSERQSLLTGWNAPAQLLEQVAEFRATAHYSAAKLVQLSLAPDPAKTVSLKYEDLQLELSPVPGQPFTYQLKASSGNKHWLHRRYDGAEGAMVQLMNPHNDGPDWLSAAEQNMLALASSDQYQSVTQFTFSAEPPSLTLYVNSMSDSTVFSKDIRFIPEAKYAANVAYPPARQRLLYSEDMYGGYYDNAEGITETAPALVEPQIVDKYGLSLQLTAEQAALCTISIVDAPEVNGHKLLWSRVNIGNNFNGAPDKSVSYQLSTADGIRRYFYDISVTSNLTCAGTPQWQTVDYQPEQSWLIDIRQLPGVDTTQSVADFVQRYRFLNAQDKALAPLSTDDINQDDYYQQSLQQVLQNGHWLAIAGRTARIEHMTATGAPVNKQWQHHFPALP